MIGGRNHTRDERKPEKDVGEAKVPILLLDEVAALIVDVADLRLVEGRVVGHDVGNDLDEAAARHRREVTEEQRILVGLEVVAHVTLARQRELRRDDGDRSEQREERPDRDGGKTGTQRVFTPPGRDDRQDE
jgi:hypothetical protein